jgi:small-conductance mechanosensitive channel
MTSLQFRPRRLATLLLLASIGLTQPQLAVAQAEAERATDLRQDIALDEQRLEDLGEELAFRNEAFEDITTDRAQLEGQLAAIEEELEGLEAEPEEIAARQLRLVSLKERVEQEKRKAALVFESMKATRDEIKLVESKLEKERAALSVLLGESDPEEVQEAGVAATAVTEPSTEKPSMTSPMSVLGGLIPAKSDAGLSTEASGRISLAETAEQIQARKTAEKAAMEALAAEQTLNEFVERKQDLEEQIKLEREQLRIADNALVVLRDEEATVQRDISIDLSDENRREDLEEDQGRIKVLAENILAIEQNIDRRRKRIRDLDARLDTFETNQTAIFAQVESARDAAEDARERVVWVNSAANPVNFLRWARIRGPGILTMLAVMLLTLWLVRFFARRVIQMLIRSTQSSDRPIRGQRAETLASSLSSVLTGIVILVTVMLVLQEAGVDIATLLGGAAILGVAIAFGAQNLMKDYFNGIMILLEDQYGLKDLVTINQVEGRVEQVNMRTTVVRDVEGRLHFIPNGQITLVTNRSYEWARALFDIPVPYSCDVDRAMEILMDEASIFCNDMDYTPLVAAKPEMLGVNEFAESSIIIRFVIKTVADMRLPVKREMLRRIKNRFDKEGISIPFPHRVIIKGD